MIVGTAGHIDHGKTSLVKALTGVDADRLKEEKARGITIELGFAYLPQPDGSVIGFVDVPGHERFVHTMLAGAHGLDLLMLIVAADDGVMPQTREHLEIVSLLGIRHGVVALTKADAVPPNRIAEVTDEIEALLADTALAGSPVFAVSSLTGEGVPALLAWLQERHAATRPRGQEGLFRLAVDRSFVLPGAGVVVTGMVLDGAVSAGDSVTVSPSGLAARVRSIHAQNRRAERGVAGERCALNLTGSGISKDALHRGDVVTVPDGHAPTRRIDAELRVAPGAAKGITQWMPARLHHATAEVGARIVLLGDRKAEPGELVRVQLVLDSPIAARALDRFILRDVSASRTLAGGRFLDLRAPERKRRTPERLALLDAMAQQDPVAALSGIAEVSAAPLDLGAFACDRGVTLDTARGWCASAQMEEWPVGATHFAFARMRRDEVSARLRETLAEFHAAQPDLPGMGLERLRMATAPRVPAPLYRILLRHLVESEGWLVVQGAWVRLASHRIEISAEEEALWRDIQPMLTGTARFRPPRVRDIARELARDEADIRRLMRRFRQAATIDEVAQDHFFLRATVAEMVRLLVALEARTEGWVTAAAFRDALEAEGGGVVGRKVAIQALEFLDRHGVTIRRGDLRRINSHRRDLFETSGEDGRDSFPVGRPDFKSGWGRETVSGGFDSHSLPPDTSEPDSTPPATNAALNTLATEAGLPPGLALDLMCIGAPFAGRPFRASTPSFRDFDSDELGACRRSAVFPAFSITGGSCALNCKHCRAEILKPMIPTGDPAAFAERLRDMVAHRGLRGFLLSGGSNRRNEVPFDRYLPVIRAVKEEHPHLQVLAHTGLVDARRAQALKDNGVDVAMLDIIGDEDTIREVYHLDRPVADFEASLAHLVAAGLTVVPHVVAGLHFGRLLGEVRALEIIARHRTEAAIMVALMPAFATPDFGALDPVEGAALFGQARQCLADRLLLLGCARPHGAARITLDVAAVLAGFDGVAYPGDEAMRAARLIGRVTDHALACCGTQACARAA